MSWTSEYLHSILRLDEATGQLFWRERPPSDFKDTPKRTREQVCNIWNGRQANKPALTADKGGGYRQGMIDQKPVSAHRVVFAMAKGYWPKGMIDHINGDPSDNRPENLREVEHFGNARNHKVRADNKLGLTGVSYNKRDKRYTARASRNGREVHVGNYKCPTAAAIARDQFYRQQRCEFARYNYPINANERSVG